jgi:hypothetical protein
MKISIVIAELFQVDGRTDRHDEADIRFSQFFFPAFEPHLLGRKIRNIVTRRMSILDSLSQHDAVIKSNLTKHVAQ